MLDLASFGSFAIMDRCLDLWPDNAHFGHNALDLNVLVDEVRFQSSRCDIVLTEISLEIYIVGLCLCREMYIRALSGNFLLVLFTIIFLHASDGLIEMVFKHPD